MADVRLNPQFRPRERRSHAERSADTRARIIAAVVESIAEVGFERTTATEITQRAGVTWGAVQHHFGGKDGILVAVLEASFNRFAEHVEGIEAKGVSLEERVSNFVDASWEHFRSRHYRTTFEILLHYANRDDVEGQDSWQQQMFAAWNEQWDRLFVDARLPAARKRRLQHYTVSVLSGLAAMCMLAGDAATVHAAELGLLKTTLRDELLAA